MIKLYFGLNPSNINKFAKAFKYFYGESTIFQDHKFLKWYFSTNTSNLSIPSNVVVEKNEHIVSHYGLLLSKISFGSKIVNINWGVNAFTIVEHSGKGYNSQIVNSILSLNTVLGVIGFTPKVRNFYLSKGFLLFKFKRFKRFVYINNSNVVRIINSNRNDRTIDCYKKTDFKLKKKSNPKIVELNSSSMLNYKINFNFNNLITTYRDYDHYKKRFFDAPYMNYKLLAAIDNDKLNAILVYRFERLYPWEIEVLKIVDLYGPEDICSNLVVFLFDIIKNCDVYYVDFRVFGNLYDKIFKEMNFLLLEDENYNVFPTTSYPVTFRENNEYVGLFINNVNFKLESSLIPYFTAADSDRDRLFSIKQVEVHMSEE